MGTVIYKICTRKVWEEATEKGSLSGVPDDVRDGFIHFSTAGQIRATAEKHFCNQDNLVLFEINASLLGGKLTWERSRNDELFPHLYDVVDVSLISQVYELSLGSDGEHIFPAEIPLR